MPGRTFFIAIFLVTAACIGNEPVTTTPPGASVSTSTAVEKTSTTTLPSAVASAENPLKIEGDAFIVRETGEEFVVRGANYFVIVPGPSGRYENRTMSPLNLDPDQLEKDFRALADRGYNTVRLFLECNDGPGCIGLTGSSGLDGDYLDSIVEVMKIAEDTDLMLLLTSNDLPDDGGYRTISARDDSPSFPGYRNSDFLTKSGHEAMVEYWSDLMNGLAGRGAPFGSVLGWSILNEHWLFGDQPPLSLTTGLVTTGAGTFDMAIPEEKRAMVVETTRLMIGQVAATIRAVDPTALVTMGFFAPDFPNPTGIGGDWYVDTALLVEDSALDFFDFHFYANEDITMEQAAKNFGIDDRKPVIMGEYGVFVSGSTSPDTLEFTVREHMARSCAHGFDGWIYWGYLRAPLDDATWSLTDAGGLLLDAISPTAVPDPCALPPNPNLAAGATVTASRFLSDQPAEFAVDGTNLQWGSGADAPQWIEIDLGSEVSVESVHLTVAQFPAGRTVHVLQSAGDDRAFTGEFTFDGSTSEGDVLVFEPSAPISARFIRVTTTTSPSWVAWREVAVFGDR